MCVTFDHDSGARFVCVFLVRDTKLVMSNDLVVGYFLPFGASDEVLCLQGGIPQHVRIASHFNEFFCWHFLPEFVQEGPIVDSKGRSDTFGQSVPIFGIVAVGPFVDCSHAALHFCETMKLGQSWGRSGVHCAQRIQCMCVRRAARDGQSNSARIRRQYILIALSPSEGRVNPLYCTSCGLVGGDDESKETKLTLESNQLDRLKLGVCEPRHGCDRVVRG